MSLIEFIMFFLILLLFGLLLSKKEFNKLSALNDKLEANNKILLNFHEDIKKIFTELSYVYRLLNTIKEREK